MTKFNVGDKVRFVEDYMDYKKGDIVEVAGFWSEGINYIGKGKSTGCYFSRVELVETKPTKNQRITALEGTVAKQSEEISELKLIVHELRGKKSIEPSTTNTVEDIIEFEGHQYRKVDREAREGDVVMQDVEHSAWMEKGHFYRVLSEGKVFIKKGVETLLYTGWNGRTVDTVNVYELIESKPLTPNEQRAAIIEKAEKFIWDSLKGQYYTVPGRVISFSNTHGYRARHDFEFIVNTDKRTIVALILDGDYNNRVCQRGIAKCDPSDVFNEHIGKAIALGRALGLDVSDFEQAVQPNDFVSGQIIKADHLEHLGEHQLTKVENHRAYFDHNGEKEFHWADRINEGDFHIINDTDAIYGGFE